MLKIAQISGICLNYGNTLAGFGVNNVQRLPLSDAAA